MLRMGLAPCACENVTPELMIAAAKLARSYPGVRLHTHVAENSEDVAFCNDFYGCSPGEYLKCVRLTGWPAYHGEVPSVVPALVLPA